MKYRRREVIEALQWTGKNQSEIKQFAFQFAMFDYADTNGDGKMDAVLKVKTREKIVPAKIGDYVVRGERGDFLLLDKNEFEQIWEKIQD